ncbi:hypothetical protein [Virgibacillus sp. 7505]|uniref:hypothetical protein n=1 Tax=Virgibacillus sp. 7505 TaxID=2022548 RepID=UPI001594E84C|nr:hypothetical protein [Virgibacillus sp. 7505]
MAVKREYHTSDFCLFIGKAKSHDLAFLFLEKSSFQIESAGVYFGVSSVLL